MYAASAIALSRSFVLHRAHLSAQHPGSALRGDTALRGPLVRPGWLHCDAYGGHNHVCTVTLQNKGLRV